MINDVTYGKLMGRARRLEMLRPINARVEFSTQRFAISDEGMAKRIKEIFIGDGDRLENLDDISEDIDTRLIDVKSSESDVTLKLTKISERTRVIEIATCNVVVNGKMKMNADRAINLVDKNLLESNPLFNKALAILDVMSSN